MLVHQPSKLFGTEEGILKPRDGKPPDGLGELLVLPGFGDDAGRGVETVLLDPEWFPLQALRPRCFSRRWLMWPAETKSKPRTIASVASKKKDFMVKDRRVVWRGIVINSEQERQEAKLSFGRICFYTLRFDDHCFDFCSPVQILSASLTFILLTVLKLHYTHQLGLKYPRRRNKHRNHPIEIAFQDHNSPYYLPDHRHNWRLSSLAPPLSTTLDLVPPPGATPRRLL
jgi:hypothetical protein